ncbi:aminomethyl-transferring glycine dehydrogenase subunit GcvPA [Martelella limonii]|uniref:aminomethyl-transferring glycine dehydrogenase subunit GcvPA n=1 Tax=Martelella limonii TaxID=1647649 RepID=UPI00157FDB30|nr:aminomethyl-transferring glycine dehydrogenase subunit GcvPA [Martelella limonii]
MPTHSHPWMANSVSAIKAEMLKETGAPSIASLFSQIPADHYRKTPLSLPAQFRSEATLKRHLREMAAGNRDCEANISFLGGGIWQHHVPAVCDELVRRQEWLTSVFGSPESDHGRNQAWFEFCSLLGELIEMDLVGMPVYSWGCAAGHAIRMAARLTGRSAVVLAGPMSPERLSVIETYCRSATPGRAIAIRLCQADGATGRIDPGKLAAMVDGETAAVYFENPNYLGQFEVAAEEIAAIARKAGALTIAGIDPLSLGIAASPAALGADLVVGSLQPLGVHMHGGGGVGGFIASPHEERFAREYPTFLVSAAPTAVAGETGFGLSLFHQTSYGMRDEGKDWTGNSTYLWTIAAAAYMALLGPEGFVELGRAIIAGAHAAAARIGTVAGVEIVYPGGFFKEFVVDFTGTGKAVANINQSLLEERIFGGIDLGDGKALYCVTEIHADADIDRLVAALERAVR